MQEIYFLGKTRPVLQQDGKFSKFLMIIGPELHLYMSNLHFNLEMHAECEQIIFLNAKCSQNFFCPDFF
jgi:hypothetical protein